MAVADPVDVFPERVIPRATYRLQLHRDFNFTHVRAILPYLSALGISHLYLSPIFQARPGSTYGYDVVNHDAINTELGSLDDFRTLSATARAHGLGILLDIVPNHMAVESGNDWWLDVLENGLAAKCANYFDIDWTPQRDSMRNRLLMPVLNRRYGDELNAGNIQLRFLEVQGMFWVQYNQQRFPLDPKTYPELLSYVPLLKGIKSHQDLARLLEQFEQLPSRNDRRPESIAQRYRDSAELKRQLIALCQSHADICELIEGTLIVLNDHTLPTSLDRLASIMDAQVYRLAYWKVAGDEINYRRFFDVNSLAALRVERPEVFAATHRLTLDLLRDRSIDGLRIDHIDGLHSPLSYLEQLRSASSEAGLRHCYIAVEKILATHERLRDDWPVEGTTGYEFGSLVFSWLCSGHGTGKLDWTYRHFLREPIDYAALVYQSKKLLMRTSLAAEIAVLGIQLDRIAHAHRDTTDFTHFALRDALTEVIAAFPVYRTYVAKDGASSDDERSISWAVGMARTRGKGSDRSIFDFIESVLLCKLDATPQAIEFTQKFQQVTAPVMAKSVEDTAFYRYCRLLAANDVGSDPTNVGISTAAFHHAAVDRARRWPHTMLSTSTHDSKRGEDVRYRLCALSEMTSQWRHFVGAMSRLNRRHHRMIENEMAPSRNDEYHLLQTLVGVWPVDIAPKAEAFATYKEVIHRVQEYSIKALREAKQRTSWIDPDTEYERATTEFIRAFLSKPRAARFVQLMDAFVEPLAFFGMLNAVSALTLKMTLPGVPDFYQGSELAELTLVDPDNRRPISFDARVKLCEQVLKEDPTSSASRWLALWREGHFKFFLIWRLLQLRRQCVSVFANGDYEPLEVKGERAEHVCAFRRSLRDQPTQCQSVVVIVSRWPATLTNGVTVAPVGEIWGDTRVVLPATLGCSFNSIIDGRNVDASMEGEAACLSLANVFALLPAAVLHSSAEASLAS